MVPFKAARAVLLLGAVLLAIKYALNFIAWIRRH
jgi:hypothetical protein